MSSKGKNLQLLCLSIAIIGWIGMLFIESSQPPLEILGRVPGLDKVAHFFAFGFLGLLVCGLSFGSTIGQPIPFFSMPLLIVGLSGLIEEIYQAYVPGRSASVPDLMADILGAMVAIVLVNNLTAAKLEKL